MNIHFHKYQGTGNDFILLDNRDGNITLTTGQVAHLCDRRFGIGADGLMLLQREEGYDFRMVYFNSDGSESTMCGNGGRCITAFARDLGIITSEAKFIAIDGPHQATINSDDTISLHMQDVNDIQVFADHCILNTGSPHYVLWTNDAKGEDVFQKGRSIRHQAEFEPKGINVNFVQKMDEGIYVRTYERGVEDETYSCGTGVTAAAVANTCSALGAFSTHIETPGGKLNVSFTKDAPGSARNVVLTGSAKFVFKGEVSI
ncbi:MAG: diaminopimelate epimerase [Flavipsychrobacter sp.]|nr:diaminopimelate epimerase [Flavipsychrobacter sp.]